MDIIDDVETDSKDPELADPIGETPNWLVKWGILVMFGILLLILAIAAIVRYPIIVESSIVITTLHPPVHLVAKATGKIQHLYVKDGQDVMSNDVLAVIESPCRYESFSKLRSDIATLEEKVSREDLELLPYSVDYGPLGDIQLLYNQFSTAVHNYQSFVHANSYRSRVKSIELQLDILGESYTNRVRQERLMQEQFKLATLQYQRDSNLHQSGVHSTLAWEDTKRSYIKDQYSLELLMAEMLTLNGQKLILEQTLQEMKAQFSEKTHELRQNITVTFKALSSATVSWEDQFVIKAPCQGKIVLNEIWTSLQNVKAGDNILIVVPQNSDSLIGRVKLPIVNSGKVLSGQKVNIKLDEYPYVEYGMVRGEVSQISSIADNNFYTAEVRLINKLTTTHNIVIAHQESITGRAEIVTDDTSLLQRFYLRSLYLLER